MQLNVEVGLWCCTDDIEVGIMSKTPQKAGDGEETALQLIKESLDEELHLVAHVFVVFGASVCHSYCNRNILLTSESITVVSLLEMRVVLVAAVAAAKSTICCWN